ncbi:Uma2 family endonuclease [Cryptosporangium minutisporangium]|uniref:Uma2 family endonuclease n=1 Tax=Cryptosporangium minutisporangium TaxID=113569 RepID=A0ABP6SWJ5_9ACTN
MLASFPVMPEGGFSLDDLDGMPEGLVRVELTDGTLSISPMPTGLHQYLAGALCLRLDQAAPPGIGATWGTEIRLDASLTRIPDVVVLRTPAPDRRWFSPGNVVLAVEIESPGTHVEERITRPALYARYGIPHYWRIEVEGDDELVAVIHRLEGGTFAETYRGGQIDVREPFPFRLELAALLPHWANRDRAKRDRAKRDRAKREH